MSKKERELKCPFHKIEIPKEREIILSDSLKFKWENDPKGYFLIKVEDKTICCGFVNSKHKMVLEIKGTDPDKIIKEIAKRKLCNFQNMGYVASELMLARYALEKDKKYIQR